MNVPRYPSSEEPIHVGDRIAFGDRTARIVIVTHTGEYAEDFPRTEWAFVPPGTIAVQFDDGQIMMYDSFCAHDRIELLTRG